MNESQGQLSCNLIRIEKDFKVQTKMEDLEEDSSELKELQEDLKDRLLKSSSSEEALTKIEEETGDVISQLEKQEPRNENLEIKRKIENLGHVRSQLQEQQEELSERQSENSSPEESTSKIEAVSVDNISQLNEQHLRNANLHMQVNEERASNLKERQTCCKEMNRRKRKRMHRLKASCDTCDTKSNLSDLGKLQEENHQLSATLKCKDHIVYNLCQKFLRMKRTKDHAFQRLLSVEREYMQYMKNMMTYIDESRKEIEYLCESRLNEPLSSRNALVIQHWVHVLCQVCLNLVFHLSLGITLNHVQHR